MFEITKRGMLVGTMSLLAAGTAVGKTVLAPLPPRRPPVLDDRIYEIAKPKKWTMNVYNVGPWGWETPGSKFTGEVALDLYDTVRRHASFVYNDEETRKNTSEAMRAILSRRQSDQKIRDYRVLVDASNNHQKLIERGDFVASAFLMFGDRLGFSIVRMEYADEDAVRAYG